MSENDEAGDSFQKRIRERFDPNNMAEWVTYSPEAFIGMVAMELRQQNVMVNEYSKILNASPQLRDIIIDPDGQRIPAEFCIEAMLQASLTTHRLLDVLKEYEKHLRTQKG